MGFFIIKMKTETKIAEENIRIILEIKDIDWVEDSLKILRKLSKEHKASCQRFLEFLEDLIEWADKNNMANDFYQDLTLKITDLKNAIKKYDEVGI